MGQRGRGGKVAGERCSVDKVNQRRDPLLPGSRSQLPFPIASHLYCRPRGQLVYFHYGARAPDVRHFGFTRRRHIFSPRGWSPRPRRPGSNAPGRELLTFETNHDQT